MTIRGRFVDLGDPSLPPLPVIDAAVQLAGEPRIAFVPFLVDTGSEFTTLQPHAARLLWRGFGAHDFASDPSLILVHGIGGSAGQITRDAILHFVDADGGQASRRLQIHIAEPGGANLNLPSLLGRDVIRHFRLTIEESADVVSLGLSADAG